MFSQGGGDVRDPIATQQADCRIPHGAEVLWRFAGSDAAGVFRKRHVADPMQAVLDTPVTAPPC